MIKKYKVLIVDDHKLFCEGLCQLLKLQSHLQVVGFANDAREAIVTAQREKPDIVFLDIEMPGGNGFEVLGALKAILPDIIIIMLTMHKNDEYLIRAIEEGACGYVLKDSSLGKLLDIIDSSIKGETRLEYNTVRGIMRDFLRKDKTLEKQTTSLLTRREIEVLRLVATKAYSNKEVASALVVSEYTIKNHLAKIYEKLKCHNRIEAILAAQRLNII